MFHVLLSPHFSIPAKREVIRSDNKQLLNEVEHDIVNYQNIRCTMLDCEDEIVFFA